MKRIYGRRPVEEFFRSRPDPAVVRRIYVSPSIPKKFMGILLPFMKGMKDRIEEKSRADLDKICNGNHQGILVEITDSGALPKSSADAGALRRPDSGKSLREALEQFPGLYVLTDRLQDGQNLGSLIRSAEVLGAMALIVTGKGVRPSEVSDRISAGGSQHLPVFTMANPDGLLRDATEREYWILAAAGRPDDEPELMAAEQDVEYGEESKEYVREIEIGSDDQDEDDDGDEDEEQEAGSRDAGERVLASFRGASGSYRGGPSRSSSSRRQHHAGGPIYLWTHEIEEIPENGRYILMVGHEGEGLKRSLIERSDYVISIPMHGRVSSLNAAVAGAILIERILSVRPPERYG